MATGKSGYVDITNSNSQFTIRIHWSETYDIASNKSTLSITNIRAQSTLWSGLWFPKGTIKVDGIVVREMDYMSPATHAVRVNANTSWGDLYSPNPADHGYDYFPWTVGTFTHEADGTKKVTFAIDLQLWRGENGNSTGLVSVSGDQEIELTTIPRASTMTIPSEITLGVAQAVTINRHSTSFSHRITTTCGSYSRVWALNGSEIITSTSFNWNPRLEIAQQNTTGTSVSMTVTIETLTGNATSGYTTIGTNSYRVTGLIPDTVKPSISSMTLSDPKEHLATFGAYVQNQSTCKVVVTASGAQNSSITSYAVSMKNSSGTVISTVTSKTNTVTLDLPKSGDSITITVKVTDSRGRTDSDDQTIKVLAYSRPTVSITAVRSNSAGVENAAGTHMRVNFTAKVSPLDNINTVAYSIRYRKKGVDTWSGKAPTVDDASKYNPNNIATVIEANVDSSYEVRIRVKDYFDGYVYSAIVTIMSQFALLHLDKTNKRIGIGKMCEAGETDILDVGLDAHFRGDVTFDNFPIDIPMTLEQGGTGTDMSSITQGRVIAMGNGKLSYWAQVPIAQGGTGATKASMALKNLYGLNLNHISTDDTDLIVPENADLNTYITPGVYRITSSTVMATLTNRPPYASSGGRLIVSATSSSPGVIQTLIYNTTYGYAFHRVMNNSSAWGNWICHLAEQPANPGCQYIVSSDGYVEWINPPMVVDTEYRTAERWNKKVVYTKLVKCGSMTSGGTVTYSTSTVYPIRFAGYCDNHALPVLLSDAYSSTWKMWVYVKNSVITTFFGSSWSKPNIYVQVWYVKS